MRSDAVGRSWLMSMSYSLLQITGGLLVHPYQTMQSLVRDKVFVWMSLLPTLVLGVVTVAWKWGVVPLVRLLITCSQLGPGQCEWLVLVGDWITFFCIYWQVLLLYLLFRFKAVLQ